MVHAACVVRELGSQWGPGVGYQDPMVREFVSSKPFAESRSRARFLE